MEGIFPDLIVAKDVKPIPAAPDTGALTDLDVMGFSALALRTLSDKLESTERMLRAPQARGLIDAAPADKILSLRRQLAGIAETVEQAYRDVKAATPDNEDDEDDEVGA